MSLITGARSAAKHRGKSATQLRDELDKATTAADKANAALDELGKAYLTVLDQLDQAGIDLSGALEDLTEAHERNHELCTANESFRAENAELKARVANLNPFTLPVIGDRDIDPDDQVTHPIDVRELRDYVNTTPDGWRPKTVTAIRRDVPASPIEVLTLRDQFAVGATKVTVTGGPRRDAA